VGIAEHQKIDAVEERREQKAPDGEVADKREFFSIHFA